ncbi:hemolysin family protein [Isobaculum melis]|uniref:Hemolysin, contains CBS domains n=1 Tax=Isobaculum melis TaxID=142588 RepID=A0A1H9UEP3_9LACT|nr:hemolysin family protein [Isobaculum melis]SES07731.1 Hemolysin, contains CBS domains [Isobaculum melis]
MIGINFILIALLIIATALFVAAEFSLVKIRSSRLDQLAAEGVKNAKLAKDVHHHLDAYLSACQLGITLTSLALGWIGESTVEAAIHPIFEWLHIPASIAVLISFILAFAIVTFLHVVVGELVPKSFAIAKTEKVVLFIVKPLYVFYKIMYPFIWILNHSAAAVAKMFGFEFTGEGDESHTEEELRLIASESFNHGDINQSELAYLNRIFEFDNRLAKEIMVPRQEMLVISEDATLDEAIKFSLEHPYTRYPVIKESKDDIIGTIHLKELVTAYFQHKLKADEPIQSLVKPVIQLIETIPVNELLEKMQREHQMIAILLDEYGGTEGMVTVEDILEELVGELRDEYDVHEIPDIRKINDHHYLLSGKVLLETIEQMTGFELEEEEGISTIGGWILSQSTEINKGDTFEENGLVFIVKSLKNQTIQEVDMQLKAPVEDEVVEE